MPSKQPVPDVTQADVERVVRRDFSAEQVEEVLGLLNKSESSKKPRVLLACLKNSRGDLESLHSELHSAQMDWRDVILTAEYPLAASKVLPLFKLPEAQRQEIYDKDWNQYQDWLNAIE